MFAVPLPILLSSYPPHWTSWTRTTKQRMLSHSYAVMIDITRAVNYNTGLSISERLLTNSHLLDQFWYIR